MTEFATTAAAAPDPQVAGLIAARLKQRIPFNDIVMEVCQATNIPWPEAAQLVRGVAARQPAERSGSAWIMTVVPLVIGAFAVIVLLIIFVWNSVPKMAFNYRHITYYGSDDHTNADPDEHWHRVFTAGAGQIVKLHYQANITAGRMWLGVHEAAAGT